MKTVISGITFIGLLTLLSGTALCAPDAPKIRLVLGLSDCIRISLKSAPELGEAQADIEQTTSRLDEAKSYRYPQIEVMTLFGPAPRARREDIYPVITTDKTFKFNEMTWFSSADATIIQPLYTFGKISENMKAATHGIEVDRSRKDQRVNEIALKVKEYYFGLMLARELKEVVLEVQETLQKAKGKARKMLDTGTNGIEEIDLFKLEAFTGEVSKYLEEAKKGESLALAALKTRLGLPMTSQLEISNERLTLDDALIPEFETYLGNARSRRPEYRQISEGLKARSALVEAAKANYYPDIFLGGLFSWAYADDRDRIRNPYINDQFKHLNGGVALGLRWKLDFGITGARVAGEQAQYNRLLSTREYADANIPLQIKKHYLDLKEAENSAAATKSAYSNAKKWAVTAVANFDFGVGPAKEILEALQAYARMRAAYFQSIYNFKIARANLEYAAGESPFDPSKPVIISAPETPAPTTPPSVEFQTEKEAPPEKDDTDAVTQAEIPHDAPRSSEKGEPLTAVKQNPIRIAVTGSGKSNGGVSGISFGDNYAEIQTTARIVHYKQIKLDTPPRLAIDIPNVKCNIASQTTPVQQFGIEKVRIGCHSKFIRIVLDFSATKLPVYEISSKDTGLRISTTPAI